jgi:lysophospholipase L1-like esterase
MKKLIHLLRFSLVLIPLLAMTADKKIRVVFFGDSITQAGVSPKGYITQLGEILKSKGAGDKYELIGAGIGGNKVYDLYLRMEQDVLAKNPDVVYIYVGINDVWHKRSHGTGTDPDKYVKFYKAIIEKLKEKSIKVILCTPSVIGEKYDYSNEQDGDLNRYAGLIRDLAKQNNLPLVDLRKSFQDYLEKNNPENKESGILTTDRVHLNDLGNAFVAEKMLEFLPK